MITHTACIHCVQIRLELVVVTQSGIRVDSWIQLHQRQGVGFQSKFETHGELCHRIKFHIWLKLIDARSVKRPTIPNTTGLVLGSILLTLNLASCKYIPEWIKTWMFYEFEDPITVAVWCGFLWWMMRLIVLCLILRIYWEYIHRVEVDLISMRMYCMYFEKLKCQRKEVKNDEYSKCDGLDWEMSWWWIEGLESFMIREIDHMVWLYRTVLDWWWFLFWSR